MKRGRRLAWAVSMSGSLVALPQSAWSREELRFDADLSASAGYSSNPFSEIGSHLGSAYIEAEARPEVRWNDEHSVITLAGELRYQHYLRDYTDTNDYGGSLDYRGMQNARLATHARLRYSSQIAGGIGLVSPVINPEQPPPVNGTDLGLFGTRQRQREAGAAADVSYTLSSHDAVSVNGFYQQSRYGQQLSAANYDGYGGGVGYSRTISDRLRLGVQSSIAQYVYSGPLGQSRVYTLQATAVDHLNSRWTASGALGASYTSQSTGGNGVHPTGNIQLCRASERANLCAVLNQTVQSTVGGTVTSTLAGVSYSYRLSERSSFNLSGDYAKQGTGRGLVVANFRTSGIGTYSAAAGFDRQLKRRVHFVATSQYRVISGGIGHYPGDFRATLGISVRVGDLR